MIVVAEPVKSPFFPQLLKVLYVIRQQSILVALGFFSDLLPLLRIAQIRLRQGGYDDFVGLEQRLNSQLELRVIGITSNPQCSLAAFKDELRRCGVWACPPRSLVETIVVCHASDSVRNSTRL
jgi:hypothetical protein